MVANPIYKGVKVKRDAVRAVKAVVSNGYYRKSVDEKMESLQRLAEKLSQAYDTTTPVVVSGGNWYRPAEEKVSVSGASMISFLHEYRHHLQNKLGKNYHGLDKEEDARAYSMRVFKKAAPRSFERAVREGRILFLKYEEGRVVNA